MKKPDIDTLLKSEDTNSALIELNNYISGLCDYGKELDRLTDPQKNFFFSQQLKGEVNSGGFDQYFYNSSGQFAHEALASLEAIGAENTATLLYHAIGCFPGEQVSKDESIRRKQLNEMSEPDKDFLKNMTQSFYQYADDLADLNLEYVRENMAFF